MKNQPTERERERERENDDDADFVNPDFKNDDSDDEKNERGWSSKSSSFLFLHAGQNGDGFLLLLLEIVFEKKDDDDFLIVIVQKCRRDDGSAKAVQKNVFKVVRDDLVVFLFEKKKKRGSVATAASSSSSESSETKVIPGDYRIGATLIAISLFLGPVCHLWFPQCAIHAILGGFLSLQASRVRFRFSETDLDVVFIQPGESDGEAAKAETDSSGDNKLQGGGANKWSFESVQNWEFWFPGFPVLVYYKENQTREEGQPHFFPIIMDGKKLYEEMLTKMPKSVNEKPNPSEWNLLTAFKSTPVGRNIIEQMSEEQVKWCEETVGLPYFDEKK